MVYAEARGGPRHLCKFSLDLRMPDCCLCPLHGVLSIYLEFYHSFFDCLLLWIVWRPTIYMVFQKRTAQSLMHRNCTTVLLPVIYLSVVVLLFSQVLRWRRKRVHSPMEIMQKAFSSLFWATRSTLLRQSLCIVIRFIGSAGQIVIQNKIESNINQALSSKLYVHLV